MLSKTYHWFIPEVQMRSYYENLLKQKQFKAIELQDQYFSEVNSKHVPKILYIQAKKSKAESTFFSY